MKNDRRTNAHPRHRSRAWRKYIWIAITVTVTVGIFLSLRGPDSIDAAETCSELEIAMDQALDEYGHTRGERWPNAVSRIYARHDDLSCNFDTYLLDVVPLRL